MSLEEFVFHGMKLRICKNESVTRIFEVDPIRPLDMELVGEIIEEDGKPTLTVEGKYKKKEFIIRRAMKENGYLKN